MTLTIEVPADIELLLKAEAQSVLGGRFRPSHGLPPVPRHMPLLP